MASISQYASGVGLCNSEYGNSKRESQVYTANNLVGKPSCYPTYGDNPRAYSLVSIYCLNNWDSIHMPCIVPVDC